MSEHEIPSPQKDFTLNVAIVMVTYKSAQLAIKSMESIENERALTNLCVRLYIIDNASGDFAELARSVEAKSNRSTWIKLILSPVNKGFASGNNLGIRRAYEDLSPDYVYLLNPDTELRPGVLDVLTQFLETHPHVGIVGSGIENPDGSEWPFAFRFPTALSEISAGIATRLSSLLLSHWEVARRMPRVASPVDWVSGASMMIRPTVLATVGGLDENYFLYFEETDLCFRASRAGFATWYVPEGRVLHFEGQSTNISGKRASPNRLPSYWFESRRRFFVVNRGMYTAIVIDVAAVIAHCLGFLKLAVLGRRNRAVAHYIRDLIRHSVLWRRNRHAPPIRTFRPSA